ncbi:branched-subunit amino acid ABC-type transport system permease component [Bradyrhizobium sp. LM6.11]
MAFYVVQFLTGLASAASLFLVASGLSIIFGVTRIVNFAHGAFYMIGAYIAFTLTERLSGTFGFWGGIVMAALAVAVIGVIVEMVLLRRIYHAPELFQLLATFGLTLMVEDLVVLIWGPDDLVGRRAPGFRGAIDFFGQHIPSYDLFLIVLSPVVLGILWLLFQRTRWGVLVRAATQDRDMVAALGVNQKWLFTSVFAVGVFLAAAGGALQIPRDAVHHAMDLRIIVEVFVVVVIGGLGSIIGALRRGGAGVGTQRLRHPDLSKNLHHSGLPGDGRGADRAALGPVRQTGGPRAQDAGSHRQSLAAADVE